MVKLCVGCKHYSRIGYLPECYSPSRGTNPVTGGVISLSCGTARELTKDCGPQGRWHEPKPLESPKGPNFWDQVIAWLKG